MEIWLILTIPLFITFKISWYTVERFINFPSEQQEVKDLVFHL